MSGIHRLGLIRTLERKGEGGGERVILIKAL